MPSYPSPNSLPRDEVESQESQVSVVVEPSDSLPREEVESQESLVSVVVEPESIPSGKVEVPVLRSFDIEDTDEYYCMYDSTWEDHPSEETSERRTKHVRMQYAGPWALIMFLVRSLSR